MVWVFVHILGVSTQILLLLKGNIPEDIAIYAYTFPDSEQVLREFTINCIQLYIDGSRIFVDICWVLAQELRPFNHRILRNSIEWTWFSGFIPKFVIILMDSYP